jgi:hypothetical protein
MGSSIAVVRAYYKGAYYKEGSISSRVGIGAYSRALSIVYSEGVGE